jgi:hypothetical protein
MWRSGPRVSADRGSTAAGRDIIGILPEQLPAILKAAIEKATDPLERLNAEQRDTIAELERQLGSTQEQIFGFFRIIGEAGIAVEGIPGKLVEIAERYQTVVTQAVAAPGDDPETARLKVELQAALERVDFDRADALLAEILAAQDRDLERRALEAASTCAQRGEVAMTRLHYREAAAHFCAAATRVPAMRESERIDYLDRQATAFYRQGEEFGDNSALRSAVDTDARCSSSLRAIGCRSNGRGRKTTSATRFRGSGSARAGRRGWRRRSRPTARRWRNGRAIGCRSTGR